MFSPGVLDCPDGHSLDRSRGRQVKASRSDRLACGEEGVELAMVERSGHFPMYSNPVEMYRRIAAFLDRI